MSDLISTLYITSILRLEQFSKNQKGVTAIEYAMIGVAIATLLAYILGDKDAGFLSTIREIFDSIEKTITDVVITK